MQWGMNFLIWTISYNFKWPEKNVKKQFSSRLESPRAIWREKYKSPFSFYSGRIKKKEIQF